MTTSQAIVEHIEALPEGTKQEALDFIEFLASRAHSIAVRDAKWTDFSLASAMCGMEDEPSPYSTADLKESFQ